MAARSTSHATSMPTEITEPVSQYEDDITAQRIIQRLQMVVRGISDAKVLGLIQEVIPSYCYSELFLEKQLIYLGIQYHLVFLRR